MRRGPKPKIYRSAVWLLPAAITLPLWNVAMVLEPIVCRATPGCLVVPWVHWVGLGLVGISLLAFAWFFTVDFALGRYQRDVAVWQAGGSYRDPAQ